MDTAVASVIASGCAATAALGGSLLAFLASSRTRRAEEQRQAAEAERDSAAAERDQLAAERAQIAAAQAALTQAYLIEIQRLRQLLASRDEEPP